MTTDPAGVDTPEPLSAAGLRRPHDRRM